MAFYKQLSEKFIKFKLPKRPPPQSNSIRKEVWEKDVEIVSRTEWGALPPSWGLEPLPWPHPCVLWTFTQTEECFGQEECGRVLRSLQLNNQRLGMPDLQHNFYIGGDLKIYEGRGWNISSGCLHKGLTPFEKMHCAFAYIGTYSNQNYPNQRVLEVKKALVLHGMENDFIDYEYRNLCLTDNLEEHT